MSPEEPSAPLFESPMGAATRPVKRSSDEVSTDEEASTQPTADLPLFSPSEIDRPEAPSSEHSTRETPQGPRPLAAPRSVEPISDSPASSSERHGASETAIASVGDRLVAAGLDLLALVLTLGLLVGVSAAMGVAVRLADLPLYLPTWLAFGFFYQVLPLLFWGRTPGMMLAGIVSRDDEGEPLTLQQAALRWLAGLVTWLLLGLPGLLTLTGRSLTDRLSGSRTLAST